MKSDLWCEHFHLYSLLTWLKSTANRNLTFTIENRLPSFKLLSAHLRKYRSKRSLSFLVIQSYHSMVYCFLLGAGGWVVNFYSWAFCFGIEEVYLVFIGKSDVWAHFVQLYRMRPHLAFIWLNWYDMYVWQRHLTEQNLKLSLIKYFWRLNEICECTLKKKESQYLDTSEQNVNVACTFGCVKNLVQRWQLFRCLKISSQLRLNK